MKLDVLIGLVQQIEKLMNTLVENQVNLLCNAPECQACSPTELEEWMGKQEVLDYLKISERTYRRQVKRGLLRPMNVGGGDFYFPSQLEKALLESRRSGKL